MSYICAEHLVKKYGTGATAVTAVRDIHFDVEAGEFVSIMGESGAGKSTLLSIIGAMTPPTSGRFLVDGIDVYGLSSEKRTDFRREFIGFVFQSFHLVPYLTVVENVMLPLTTVPASRKRKHALAGAALAQVGLSGKEKRLPSQISGGEKERVAIARAIVNEPPVVLADEPTGNLDSKTSREVMELLQRLNQKGATILMVTHSPACAGYAERVMKVSDGCLAQENEDPVRSTKVFTLNAGAQDIRPDVGFG
ncbi:MAG: ABC transporter ATP-binding protein [Deltaproteobacteria bacterium]